ncbi:MAG: hypothetical protein ACRC37_03140, partial [Lentisphaeria bacterium]
LGFDLITIKSRPSDRLVRREEKYLFLETLLSARDKFYLSYVGQNNMDNSEKPPSVLVSELLDFLGVDNFVEKHPLQPFSKSYFLEQSNLFSFSKVNYDVAISLENERKNIQLNDRVEVLPYSEIGVSFDEFVKFFISPCRSFLLHTLNMKLPSKVEDDFIDNEIFTLDSLSKYLIKKSMLTDSLYKNSNDLSECEGKSKWHNSKYILSGKLPIINATKLLDELNNNLAKLLENLANYGNKVENNNLVVYEKRIEDLNIILSGKFTHIFEANGTKVQLFYRPAKIKNKDKINGWIWHVLVNSLCGNKGIKTIILGEDDIYEYNDFSNIDLHFSNLLGIFKSGMHAPIPFFLNTSISYIEQQQKIIDDIELETSINSIKASLKNNWVSYNGLDCDGTLDEIKLVYSGQYPLDDERNFNDFVDISTKVIPFQVKKSSRSKKEKTKGGK